MIDCWDASWSERKRLVFDNTAQTEALTDFAVLVTLNAGNIDYSLTQNGGQDLRFVQADGTVLAHEIESWNEAGESVVWVRVPTINGGSSADFVYMHYGNPSAQDAQAVANVWNAEYQGVWHLSEKSGPQVDSAKGSSCTWLGSGGTQDAVGVIAGANNFDGTEDVIDCGTDNVADNQGNTITAWVNLSLTGNNDQCIVSIENFSAPFPGTSLYVRRTSGALGSYHENFFEYGAQASSIINPNEWSFVSIRSVNAADGVVEVSKNGGVWETIASGDTSDLQIPSGTPLTLGKWAGGGPGTSTNGLIDEIRISGVARSDDWIRAQYLSMSNSFVTFFEDEQDCL
jgi:hypothetical protein